MRLFKFATISFYLLLASGCASVYVPPMPEYSLPENSKLGLLVTVGEHPKHSHVGTTIFNNFVKEYEYDWDMEEAVFQIYKEEIESTTGFSVVNLRDHGIAESSDLNFVDIKNKQWAENDANKVLRQTLIEKGIYAVVSISEAPTLASLECSNYGCAQQYSDGYGLFTRSIFGMDRYVASASFNISTEIIRPLIDIGAQEDMREVTHFANKNKTIADFSDPADFKNITEDELAPAKEGILEFIKSLAAATSRYLTGANPASAGL